MTKGKKRLKSEKYSVIYWPVSIHKKRLEVYDLLLDIDCNYSRFLQSMIHNLADICRLIKSIGKNFRHFNWHLLIVDKETGEGYSSLRSGQYNLTNLKERLEPDDRKNHNAVNKAHSS